MRIGDTMPVMDMPEGAHRADDYMIGGNHYKDMAVEPWQVIENCLTQEEWVGFLKGNIIRYSMRQGKKEGTDDGAKAKHYIQKLKEVQDGSAGW